MKNIILFLLLMLPLKEAVVAQTGGIYDGFSFPTIARINKGYLTKAELMLIDSIEILFINDRKDYTITGFTMCAGFPEGMGGSSDYFTESNSNKLTAQMKSMISNLPISEQIFIEGVTFTIAGDNRTYYCSDKIEITISGSMACLKDYYSYPWGFNIVGLSRNETPVKFPLEAFINNDSILVASPISASSSVLISGVRRIVYSTDSTIKIMAYDFGIYKNPDEYKVIHVTSNEITKQIKRQVRKRAPCDIFIFNIGAVDQTGKAIEVGYLELTLIPMKKLMLDL